MHITTDRFIGLIAVVVGTSWASYSLEMLQGIPPPVRRGLQVTIMGVTCLWALRMLGAV